MKLSPLIRRCRHFMIFSFLSFYAHAQEYGLEFVGHEENPDRRTSLEFGKETQFKFDQTARLSFDLRFKKNVSSYFGHVFRWVDTEGHSIELLFKNTPTSHFRLVTDRGATNIFFHLDSTTLYTKWTQLSFELHSSDRKITIYVNGQAVATSSWKKPFGQSFRGHFGGSQDLNNPTRDVLPFLLRDVKWELDGQLAHHWPLNEFKGSVFHDLEGKVIGTMKNGRWLLHKHYAWSPLLKTQVPGWAVFHFDPAKSTLFIHHDRGLVTQKTTEALPKRLADPSSHQKFTYGDQAIYRSKAQKGALIRLQEREVFTYDPTNSSWKIPHWTEKKLTEYWHHNVVNLPLDTALIMMGGYGMFTYKNQFFQYSFPKKSWTTLQLTGDVWSPRYLFGAGSTQNGKKTYLFGGFGSPTGQQELLPQNYYDLFEVDWATKKLRKIYSLETPKVPFVVAQSLIIDEKNRVFYALVYNQLSYSTHLQLIKGSLDEPKWEFIGTKIPYSFHDIASFANLYLDESNQILVAVLSVYDRLKFQTNVQVFTLDFPPTQPPPLTVESNSKRVAIWVGLGAVLLLVLFVFGLIRNRFRGKNQINRVIPSRQEVSPDDLPVSNQEPQPPAVKNTSKSTIFLFGGFELRTWQGADLTSQFTPLLKELFIYLLLQAIVKRKSVHATELDEMFWFDKSTNSARNNRSVNLTKLKSILDQVEGIDLKKDKGNWTIHWEKGFVEIDYDQFCQIIHQKPLKSSQVEKLNQIVSRGAFLPHLDYKWLEPFQSETTFQVVEAYLQYIDTLDPQTHTWELIEIADKIFLFDSVDEVAMEIKCKALIQLGKHSLAKDCYENFVKEYGLLYNQPFAKSYQEILQGS